MKTANGQVKTTPLVQQLYIYYQSGMNAKKEWLFNTVLVILLAFVPLDQIHIHLEYIQLIDWAHFTQFYQKNWTPKWSLEIGGYIKMSL